MSHVKSEDTHEPSTLTRSQAQYVRKNAHDLADLPAPGERWVVSELPDRLARKLQLLRRNDVIVRSEQMVEHDDGHPVYEWETDADAYRAIQAALDDSDALLPCGHSALHNARDVDGIRCGVASCGAVHSRAAIRAWQDDDNAESTG